MRKFFFSAAIFLGFATAAVAADASLSGVVNFASCITDSKVGQKEQENMDNMRKQMASMVEGTEKELKEISAKLEDTEYLDSLSPKAEEDLKTKYQNLQEDLGRYQNQFYQVLNHANYQMIQKLNGNIAKASEAVAKEKKLDYIVNKEACFYTNPNLDVTNSVIAEMDKNFELEAQTMKKLSENTPESAQMSEETSLKKAG